jgi:hypothetical protein
MFKCDRTLSGIAATIVAALFKSVDSFLAGLRDTAWALPPFRPVL